ncbi:MAG: hypothetical protein ACI82H_001110 [Alphaproteobacteria bacterium]|jgi:hypothetical protein
MGNGRYLLIPFLTRGAGEPEVFDPRLGRQIVKAFGVLNLIGEAACEGTARVGRRTAGIGCGEDEVETALDHINNGAVFRMIAIEAPGIAHQGIKPGASQLAGRIVVAKA